MTEITYSDSTIRKMAMAQGFKRKWITLEEALFLLNIKKSKFYELVKKGRIISNNAGHSRNIQYLYDSISRCLDNPERDND